MQRAIRLLGMVMALGPAAAPAQHVAQHREQGVDALLLGVGLGPGPRVAAVR